MRQRLFDPHRAVIIHVRAAEFEDRPRPFEDHFAPFQFSAQREEHPFGVRSVGFDVRHHPDGMRQLGQLVECGAALVIDQREIQVVGMARYRQRQNQGFQHLAFSGTGHPAEQAVRSVRTVLVAQIENEFRCGGRLPDRRLEKAERRSLVPPFLDGQILRLGRLEHFQKCDHRGRLTEVFLLSPIHFGQRAGDGFRLRGFRRNPVGSPA